MLAPLQVLLHSLHQQALTGERLKKIGFIGPSKCLLYELVEESEDRSFLHCSYASACCHWFFQQLGVNIAFPSSICSMLST